MQTIIAHEMGSTFNVAVVASRFYYEIVENLCYGTIERFKELEFSDNQITLIWVPGVEEIPLIAKRLAKTKKYQAIVCLGVVIRGETDIFDYVCQQVSFGCQKVALKTDTPVIFGIIPAKNADQAIARSGGKHGNRGREAADAAFEMVSIMRQIDTQ